MLMLNQNHLVIVVLSLLGLVGCFDADRHYAGPQLQVQYDHLMDLAWVHESRHKGVVPIRYKLLGVQGPQSLHLSDDSEMKTVVKFDLIDVPKLEQLNLSAEELEIMRVEAMHQLRNYFGAQKEVVVYVMKRELKHELRYFALDARHPERDLSAVDFLVTRGLAFVNQSVAKLAGMDYLITLEKEAREEDRGFWKNYLHR